MCNLKKSLALNKTNCELNCTVNGGHIPYLYEVDSILSQLYQNETINVSNFPIFSSTNLPILPKDSLEESFRKFSFFISTKYDFQKRTWKSGGFEIKENYWAERNVDEKMYPILDDTLLLVRNTRQWTRTDHWGAVSCNGSQTRTNDLAVQIYDNSQSSFKV